MVFKWSSAVKVSSRFGQVLTKPTIVNMSSVCCSCSQILLQTKHQLNLNTDWTEQQ